MFQDHAFGAAVPPTCSSADAILHALHVDAGKANQPMFTSPANPPVGSTKLDRSARAQKRTASALQDDESADGALPNSPGMTKRHRAGPSRLDQTTWPATAQDGSEAPHVTQPSQTRLNFQPQTSHPGSHAQLQSQGSEHASNKFTPQPVSSHTALATGKAASAFEGQPQKSARRVVPEALPCKAAATAAAVQSSKGSSMQNRQTLSRTLASDPRLLGQNVSRNPASDPNAKRRHSDLDLAADHSAVSDSQVQGSAMSDVSSEHTEIDGEEEEGIGSDEEEEGRDGGEEEEGKVLMEFGSRGDLWWDDFIAAKEDMLTNVLQVCPSW